MDKRLVVSRSVAIDSPKEVVWRVLTEPSFVKRYLYGAELVTDWSVGSPILFRGEFEGQPWQDKGLVLGYDSPGRLQYSYWSGSCGLDDRPENYATISYELAGTARGTLLSIRQEGYASESSRARSERSWESILAQVKALAESS